MENKYQIIEQFQENTCECGCIAGIEYILYENGKSVYEANSKEDCLLGIINREGIEVK